MVKQGDSNLHGEKWSRLIYSYIVNDLLGADHEAEEPMRALEMILTWAPRMDQITW